MKWPWPILLPVLMIACKPTGKQQVVRDSAGRVRAELERVGGIKEGPVKFLDGSGAVRTTGLYKDDHRSGTWVTYGNRGDTLSVLQFRKGRKNGLQGYWSSNGHLLRLEEFSNGIPNGFLYRFFADGSPRQITWYRNGVPEGDYLEWYKVDSTSVALTCGQFRAGERSGLWTWFYGNGKPSKQGRYTAGKATGVWRRWNAQGKLIAAKDLGSS
jgi:antitoxin component YwqK of YwqJK toxin-antitoxin module